jgi:hypothetical protein
MKNIEALYEQEKLSKDQLLEKIYNSISKEGIEKTKIMMVIAMMFERVNYDIILKNTGLSKEELYNIAVNYNLADIEDISGLRPR